MNTQKYITLLANPELMKPENISELGSVIDAYPFFQSARALWLKGLKRENSFRYNDALKVTAAHTTNRDILFEYITSKSFSQNEIARQIKKHDKTINELNVEIAEDVSKTISVELDTQMKAEIKKAEAILDPSLFEKKAQEVQQILHTSEILKSENKITQKTIENQKGTSGNISALPDNNVNFSPEKILKIDEPLEFKKEDTHSFSEWLKLTAIKPIERKELNKTTQNTDQKDDTDREHKFNLIEKFIADRPKLTPVNDVSPQKNLAEPFTKSSDSLMTETLAKVYLQQKNYKKARTAYRILILKYPEKSGFFADQIRAIDKLIEK